MKPGESITKPSLQVTHMPRQGNKITPVLLYSGDSEKNCTCWLKLLCLRYPPPPAVWENRGFVNYP